MGNGAWTSSDWSSYAKRTGISKAKDASEIYKTGSVKEIYLPHGITRESCDSDEHPESTPIAIGLDVTGSMGPIIHSVAKKLGDFVGDIYNKKTIKDPQIMFGAIDDYFATETPLQVTQFESDIRIAEQLTDLKFISRGAGNGFESYPLFWYFCARHTKLDCVNNRSKKGFLFTMGDDGYPKSMSGQELKDIFGDEILEGITTQKVLDEVMEKYEIFHLCFAQGGSYRESDYDKWKSLMGNRAIKVTDWECLPEIITSIMELYSGVSLEDILSATDVAKQGILEEALKELKAVTSIVEEDGMVIFKH